MRILIISSWYPPIQSGSSFYAESLAIGLKKIRHDVSVVTTDWKLKSYTSSEQDGIKIHYLPAWLLPRVSFLLNLKIIPVSCTPYNQRRLIEIVRNFSLYFGKYGASSNIEGLSPKIINVLLIITTQS